MLYLGFKAPSFSFDHSFEDLSFLEFKEEENIRTNISSDTEELRRRLVDKNNKNFGVLSAYYSSKLQERREKSILIFFFVVSTAAKEGGSLLVTLTNVQYIPSVIIIPPYRHQFFIVSICLLVRDSFTDFSDLLSISIAYSTCPLHLLAFQVCSNLLFTFYFLGFSLKSQSQVHILHLF